MSLREKIEKTIQGFLPLGGYISTDLLNQLEALLQEPPINPNSMPYWKSNIPKLDRVELERILLQVRGHACDVPECGCYPCKALTNDIMTWAEGRKKEWCFHIRFSDQSKRWVFDMEWKENVYHATGNAYRFHDEWDICPVKDCHAPRPQ